MRDLVFACCWIILFPAAFLSAHVGVLLWIWVALSTPNLMLYNFLVEFPFNKMVAVITAALVIFKPEKKDFYLDTVIILFTAFILIGNISNFMTTSAISVDNNVYDKVMKEFVLFVVITGVMYSRHRIHATILTFCISLALVGAFEAAAYIASGMGHKVLGTGALGDNNGVAAAMLMSTPLCLYIYNYSQEKIIRLGFLVLVFCNVITIFATFSRGGFLGLLVLGSFMIVNSRSKIGPIAIIAAAVLLLMFLAPPEWYERIDTLKDADSSTSFLGRVVAWKVALLAALDRPFYGAGFHALQDIDLWNKYIPNISMVDFFPTPVLPSYALAAHSIFFEVLGDTGFTGLGCFLGILVMSLINCGRISKRCRAHPELLWANDLARALRVTIVVFITAGAALSFAYFEGLWVIIAVISRLNRTTLELTRPRTRAELALEASEQERDVQRSKLAELV